MTNVQFTVLALVVAVAAAVRSTWSPCGWSMLSTITPISERSRGHRYGLTAGWFVVGSVAGGATLGGLAALLAVGVGALDPPPTAALTLAAACAGLAALVDLGAFGAKPPFFHRQVNDDWLSGYRPWVYGLGFGWQIGAGLTTYIMTAGVVLTVALAALTGTPLVAVGVGLAFGLVRGLAVLLSARLDSPSALTAFHRRFGAAEEPVRLAVVVVQALVGLVAVGLAWGPAPVAVAAVALAGGAWLVQRALGAGGPRTVAKRSRRRRVTA